MASKRVAVFAVCSVVLFLACALHHDDAILTKILEIFMEENPPPQKTPPIGIPDPVWSGSSPVPNPGFPIQIQDFHSKSRISVSDPVQSGSISNSKPRNFNFLKYLEF